MKTRLFSLWLLLLVAVGLSAYDFEVGNLCYSVTDWNSHTVEIIYDITRRDFLASIEIPETVTYKGDVFTITSIGAKAFYYCGDLHSVIIPNSVTSIGDRAFGNCTSLSTIIIPNNVTSIGEVAFGGCEGLTSVTIGNGVTSIGDQAFVSCTSITSIVWNAKKCNILEKQSPFYDSPINSFVFGDNVQHIPDHLCNGLKNLTSIKIPNGVTSIGKSAFEGCTNLSSITIPNTVTSIGYGAFANTLWYANKRDGYVYINNVLYAYKGTIPRNASLRIKEGIVSISPSVFSGCTNLQSISIPGSVTSIGEFAFYNCSNLATVNISNSMNSTIGEGAFTGTLWYQNQHNGVIYINNTLYCYKGAKQEKISIKIKEGTTYITPCAFSGCINIDSITIPSSLKNIGREAFARCRDLTFVSVPDGVETIEESAFSECKNLTSITIPKSVKSIGESAFSECKKLTSITIPNSVTSIGKRAFDKCEELSSVTFGNNVRYIGVCAFSGCKGLTAVSIPKGVTNIEMGVFANCNNLTSVTIPNSVTNIRDYAFSGCGITSIILPDNVTYLSGFDKCYNLTSITIPKNVIYIGNCAFESCYKLTSIIIPNRVTSIGYNAFKHCSFTSITIPKNVTYIGQNIVSSVDTIIWNAKKCLDIQYNYFPFSSVSAPVSFIFGDSVQYIPNYLFANMSGLSSITIPNNVISIGEKAFEKCALTSIIWNAGKAKVGIGRGNYTIWNNGVYDLRPQITSFAFGDSVKSIPTLMCGGMVNLTSVTISNSVTGIGNWAFEYCTSLTSVTIPNSVASIGSSTFSGCTGLTSITIPNSVTSIESSTFEGCTALTSVTIPNSVTSIGSSTFEGCTALTSVTIPNSVTSIGSSAFEGCTGLTSITIPNSVTNIRKRAFEYCTSLTSVTIPNSVTSIGSSAFEGCTGLTSVIIGNSVTRIEYGAFYSCTGLTSVTIGNNVKYIETVAFGRCENIRTLFVKAKEPPTWMSSDAFSSIDYNIPVIVPCGTIGAYKNADKWKWFTNYVEYAAEYNVMALSQDSTKGVVKIVQTNTCNNDTTIIVAEANEHYRFDKWSDGNMDNPRKVVVVGDTTYIAEFVLLTNHTILGTCNSLQGAVMGSGTYQYGTIATLTALPNEGYVFTQWSDGNKDNPRKVTVTADATYTAEFALQTYTITATCDSKQGQITGGGTYTVGQEVYLTALSNEGYVFTQWSDGNKDNPRKVTVTADATYTAEFTSQTYTITATCDSKQGQVTGGGTYTVGREVYLTATPNIGYAFTQWSDGNKDNPRKVTVTADAIYTAEFALQIYMIIATCDNQQGQVTGGGVYLYGSEVTITAIPNKGYEFVRWSDGNTTNPYSFLVEKDMTIEALFEPTTPIENVVAEEHIAPRKVFRDGQVYILQGGKAYTLTGVEVNL